MAGARQPAGRGLRECNLPVIPAISPFSDNAGVNQTRAEPSDGFDLLRLRIIRGLILWRGFPGAFQILLLGAFVALVVLAWGMHAPVGASARLYARCNLTTLLVWGIWWPAMVWIAVLFGRAWCAVCPLELVSNLSERLAAWLRLPRRPLPRWIAAGSIIVVLYAAIQMLVAGAHINRVPGSTALFLAGLFIVALASGLVFKDRAFCRGFCPVGLLLGTYGRGAMLAVRPGAAATCAECPARDCVVARNRSRFNARSCPSLLNPARLDRNRDCLVCGQCIKACAPGNMRLLLRRPFAAADARELLASWPVTLFVMLASGFVVWELFTEWPGAEARFLAFPAWISTRLGMAGSAGWFEGVWALFVVPLGLWAALAVIVRLHGETGHIGNIWRRIALPMAVVIAAGHMSKGVAKLVTWAPFLPRAIREPGGVESTRAIVEGIDAAPAALLSPTAIAVVGMALVVTACFFAVRECRLIHREHRDTIPRAYGPVPLVLTAAVFVAIITGWTRS